MRVLNDASPFVVSIKLQFHRFNIVSLYAYCLENMLKSVKFLQKVLHFYFLVVYLQSQMRDTK